MSAVLLAGALLGCGALSTPPEPLVSGPVTVTRAVLLPLEPGEAEVVLALESGLRRELTVEAGAYELRGLSGVLAHADRLDVGVLLPAGGRLQTAWRTALAGSGEGSLAAEAPLVLSGTLWVHASGRGTELVPFTVPVSLHVVAEPVPFPSSESP